MYSVIWKQKPFNLEIYSTQQICTSNLKHPLTTYKSNRMQCNEELVYATGFAFF